MAPKIKAMMGAMVQKGKKAAKSMAKKAKSFGKQVVNAGQQLNKFGGQARRNIPKMVNQAQNAVADGLQTAKTIRRKATNTVNEINAELPAYRRKAENTVKIARRMHKNTITDANKLYKQGQDAITATKGFVDRLKNAGEPTLDAKRTKNLFKAVTKRPLEDQVGAAPSPNPVVDLPSAVPKSVNQVNTIKQDLITLTNSLIRVLGIQ